jgi:hypothetical protein
VVKIDHVVGRLKHVTISLLAQIGQVALYFKRLGDSAVAFGFDVRRLGQVAKQALATLATVARLQPVASCTAL